MKEALLSQAKTHISMGNVSEAQELLKKVLAESPTDFEGLWLTAQNSRGTYPGFSGTNKEYLEWKVKPRIKPVLANYLIALNHAPLELKETLEKQAVEEVIEYAVLTRQDVTSTGSGLWDSNINDHLRRQLDAKNHESFCMITKEMVDMTKTFLNLGYLTEAHASKLKVIFYGNFKKKPPYDFNNPHYEEVEGLRSLLMQKYPNSEIKAKPAGCFPKSTLISTPSGKISIAAISVGDRVCTFDHHGNQVTTIVTKKTEHEPMPLCLLRLEDQTVLKVTSNHKIKSNKGWVRIDQLDENTLIFTSTGTKRVQSIDSIKEEKVFNLITHKYHTFIADDCIVHSFSKFRVCQSLIHTLFIDPVHYLNTIKHRLLKNI